MKNLNKFLFKDVSKIDVSSLNKEELLEFRRYVELKMFKHASHLIRLLRMGIEFLNDGELYVTRQDAQQLVDIKQGKWTLDQVKKEADKLFDHLKDAYYRSKLPTKPNYEAINDLCVELVRDHYKEKNIV